MYVSSFWSYKHYEQSIQITNSITGHSAVFPVDALNILESAALKGDVSRFVDSGVIDSLIDLNIVFRNEVEADLWFQRIERDKVVSIPLIDQIELTNRCPYRCKMCPRTTDMTRPLGDMDIDLFTRIIEQIAPHQDYVALHHFGESLVYRKLPDAVARAKSIGLRTGLSCNPPSLKPHIAARLLDAGIASLLLSLDSLDPETYRAIRGPAADIERARNHITELVRLRDTREYTTSITVQFIQMADNDGEAESFLTWARHAGVDRAVVVRLGRWDFDDSRVGSLGRFDSPLHGDYCRRPWQSVVVLWDGRVVPCCHDYDGRVVLGDLREQSLAEIWTSERAMDFRNHAHASSLCATCAFSKPFRESHRPRGNFQEFHRQPRAAKPLEYLRDDTRFKFDFNGFNLATA